MSACCCVVVSQSRAGILERIGGQFDDVLPPGIHCINPCGHKLAGTQTLRTQLLKCETEAMTRDSASVHVKVTIIYKAIAAQVHRAYYSMSGTQQQITSLVVAHLRGSIPEKTLDEVFLERQQIATQLRNTVGSTLQNYGFDLIDVLMEDVAPGMRVREAMNAQVYQRYNRVVQEIQGEIAMIKRVKAAEAEAEQSRLRGEGTAKERSAIAQGFEDGMQGRDKNGQVSESELTAIILMTQYFDMLNDLATQGAAKPAAYYMPMNQHGRLDRDELQRRLKIAMYGPSSAGTTAPAPAATVKQRTSQRVVEDSDL
jgi:regulator of protease activity HflC (stomatin/prohibitin superfamily)